ncbi:MAG: GNAT family N-acetyltransferase [Gammaproteobacteria bacterium]
MNIAQTDEEILACFEVMKQLRPLLTEDTWLSTIRHMQQEGYHLAWLGDGKSVTAVAGYYYCHKLSVNGRSLYVYDLVTDQAHRSEGFGKRMIDALKELARKEGCVTLELDSGVQRFGAHRFYLREGFHIASHHFACPLSQDASN